MSSMEDDYIKMRKAVDEATRSLGFNQIKKLQDDAIMSFVAGNDTFVSLPTGYGKSLIYGCLPRVFDLLYERSCSSIVLVVCPLRALMKDQAETFKKLGLTAAYVGDKSISLDLFVSGYIQLIFISPESLRKGSLWRNLLRNDVYQKYLMGIVIDEAHLIKTWLVNNAIVYYYYYYHYYNRGEDYRPEFSYLGELRSFVPKAVHIMALTATATSLLQKHVIEVLHMTNPIIIETSPEKKNLRFFICDFKSIKESFLSLMIELDTNRTKTDKTLIFCRRPIDCANVWMAFWVKM